jgi:hypothetical protein
MTLRLFCILVTLFVGLSPAAAFNINLNNGDSYNAMLVKVWDENTPNEDQVYNGTLDAGASTVPVELTAAKDKGHIKWEAKTADRQKCGSGDEKDLDNGANVTINATDSCKGSAN